MELAPLPRYRFMAGIVCICLLEWLLFELLRAPYRPPRDMTTFLGTEKYPVFFFMALLAVISLLWGAWFIFRRTWTRQDVTGVTALIALILLLGACAVFAPRWPVTPWHLILQ